MFDPKIALNMIQKTISNLQNPGKPPAPIDPAKAIAALQSLATTLQAQIPPNTEPPTPAPKGL